jgi:hypothetical protein
VTDGGQKAWTPIAIDRAKRASSPMDTSRTLKTFSRPDLGPAQKSQSLLQALLVQALHNSSAYH